MTPRPFTLIAELTYVAGLAAPDGHNGEVWLPTSTYDRWADLDPATIVDRAGVTS